MKKKRTVTNRTRKTGLPVSPEQLDARPDVVDFRDKLYIPTLIEVPPRISLDEYTASYRIGKKKLPVPVLNQGKEGACTGFGLAAVANFLLSCRKVQQDTRSVSPRMFYEMAKRYDEWAGENYEGSSARGAMKAWHKHGVCGEELWSYDPGDEGGTLTNKRALDAASRPLGAYFRVNHRELVAMHSALAEVRILYATCSVHAGWGEVKADGIIPFSEKILGGHAFAVVGYDEHGFWLQNSWGPTWGKNGFGRIAYDDWLANGTDVWVARLGAPVQWDQDITVASTWTGTLAGYSFHELRPHIISIGNNGRLLETGIFGTSEADVDVLFNEDIPRITSGWKKKRLLLYAHGGLVSEDNALQRVEEYRRPLIEAEVYPMAFIWRTDFWTTIKNILRDAIGQRRPEGALDSLKDFMLDRLDDSLEPLARPLGKALWDEMKENALLATTDANGGARYVLQKVNALLDSDPTWEIHLAGHSAGSIFMGPVAQMLCAHGNIGFGNGPARQLQSVSLWAPACTIELFRQYYFPAIENEAIKQFNLFTLKDAAEQDDDCANIYHKSLLYLVSNAFEDKSGLLWKEGTPILGMEKFILQDHAFFRVPTANELKQSNPPTQVLFERPTAVWIRSPNGLPESDVTNASYARHHGDFDDDKPTVKATLARILGNGSLPQVKFGFRSSPSKLEECRQNLE